MTTDSITPWRSSQQAHITHTITVDQTGTRAAQRALLAEMIPVIGGYHPLTSPPKGLFQRKVLDSQRKMLDSTGNCARASISY